MANLTETSRWEAGIYQWETSDPVQGGPNGIDNRPTRELANRTRWLHDELARTKAKLGDSDFYKSLTVADSKQIHDGGSFLLLGADSSGGYIRNKKSNKSIEFKNDGILTYDGADILTAKKLSQNYLHGITSAVASSYALKRAYDESVKRGGAVGLGGASHEIAIGWDTPGLIAKVDNTILNVGVPTGGVIYFANGIPPFGWLKANGAAVSRTVYANLFAAIGTTYGAGDGRTTFNLPDLRGEFIRGWDDGRRVDAGRALGSAQADAIQRWFAEFTVQRGQVEGVEQVNGAVEFLNSSTSELNSAKKGGWAVSTARLGPAVKNSARVAEETRPRNIALMPCIKI